MKTPSRLFPLLEASLIDEVVSQLQSGKEADVYVVRRGEAYQCAKVYKEANNRTFKHKTQYTEGRKARNSRRSRAMDRNTKFGRKERENEWQNTEVDALRTLADAGVRVPQPHEFYEGVLLLEMITDEAGNPAPRLNDVVLTKEQAQENYRVLIEQVVLMLCAGMIHGDLSEFNILLSPDGLVIIDLPQAVQATANNAFAIFERDMTQLTAYFGRFAPELRSTDYANEIWNLYKNGKLSPKTKLTGKFQHKSKKVDVKAVLDEIEEAREESLSRGDPDS